VQDAAGNWEREPSIGLFDYRSYGVFGWLGGVRNYSEVPPIAPSRGLPDDVSREVRAEWESWGYDAHSTSWASVEELADFDYGQAVEDRRVTIGHNGAHTADPGGGTMTTYREFLGSSYFADLDRLKSAAQGHSARVVFWFDN
ncbi:hypothetical protein ACWCW7_35275, partial [Nocardia tengchongensis]